MGQRVTDTATVAAAPATIMDIITDLEAYPEWTDGIEEVEVLERGADGEPLVARFRVDARVVEVTYTLRYEYGNGRLSWTLEEGEMVSQLDGSYDLTPQGDTVLVRYTIEADVDVPVPAFMKKRAAKKILDTGLHGLKERAEARG